MLSVSLENDKKKGTCACHNTIRGKKPLWKMSSSKKSSSFAPLKMYGGINVVYILKLKPAITLVEQTLSKIR